MKINFEKYPDRLAPAIVQDAATGKVLMLGYMNEEAFEKTRSENRVTFFSRSKQRLWTKGETSGNFLDVADILADCDSDAILIKARPHGAVCHMGSDTCFGETNRLGISILEKLESTIADRFEHPQVQSYVSGLAAKGINKIAQKSRGGGGGIGHRSQRRQSRFVPRRGGGLAFSFSDFAESKRVLAGGRGKSAGGQNEVIRAHLPALKNRYFVGE